MDLALTLAAVPGRATDGRTARLSECATCSGLAAPVLPGASLDAALAGRRGSCGPDFHHPGPARWLLASGTATAGGITSTARPSLRRPAGREQEPLHPHAQRQTASSCAFEIGAPSVTVSSCGGCSGNPPGRERGSRDREVAEVRRQVRGSPLRGQR